MLDVDENTENRAGHYVRQPAGYRAFIPAKLPPRITIDNEMQDLLSKADRALGRLDGSIQTLPNPDLFVFMYVRKEAVLSSQIEGTQASINDLIKAEADLFGSVRRSDITEVTNYVAAMNRGLDRLKEIPLSLRLIYEIHERLLRNVRGNKMNPGEMRRSQNWIGPQGCTLMEATFVPPPHQVAEEAFGDLEKFLHDESPLPALLRIGIAHAQFETIHPFLDGNGRIGRLLITFFLCNQAILQKPVLYISYYFKQYRDEYYKRLQDVRDKGDWESWLKFFLLGTEEVARQATETARKIVAMREEHRALIVNNFGNHGGKGARLLEKLYERPTITISDVCDYIGVSFPNASSLVEKFRQNQLLFEVTGNHRNRIFLYQPYIDLFSNI